MDEVNNTNELIDNAAAELVNASAKAQASEIREQANESVNSEMSAIQQSTTLLNADTQAQKRLNEEKQKTITLQQASYEAFLKSEKAREELILKNAKTKGEMIVYHGSASIFDDFDSNYNHGTGQHYFGKGIYATSSNDSIAPWYAYKAAGEGNSNILKNINSSVERNKKFIQDFNSGDIIIPGIDEYEQKIKEQRERLEHWKKELDNIKSYEAKYGEDKYSIRDKKNYTDIINEIESVDLKSALKEYNDYVGNFIKKNTVSFNKDTVEVIKSIPTPYMYSIGIPKNNGSNYLEADKEYKFNELIKNTADPILIDKFITAFTKGVPDINSAKERMDAFLNNETTKTGRSINNDLLTWNSGVTNEDFRKLGYIAYEYPARDDKDEAVKRYSDKDYVIFNKDDISMYKREDLYGDTKQYVYKETNTEENYTPIQYLKGLDESLLNATFDGSKFISDISDVVKEKLIQGISGGVASGSFIVGPEATASSVRKVNDVVLTNGGQVIEPNPKDTIFSMIDPQLSFTEAIKKIIGDNPQLLYKENKEGKPVSLEGVITEENLNELKNITETLLSYEKRTSNRNLFPEEAKLRERKEQILKEASGNLKFVSLANSSSEKATSNVMSSFPNNKNLEGYFREKFLEVGIRTFSDAEKNAYNTAKNTVEKFERDYKNPSGFVGYQSAYEKLSKMNKIAESRAALLSMNPRMASYTQPEIDTTSIMAEEFGIAEKIAELNSKAVAKENWNNTGINAKKFEDDLQRDLIEEAMKKGLPPAHTPELIGNSEIFANRDRADKLAFSSAYASVGDLLAMVDDFEKMAPADKLSNFRALSDMITELVNTISSIPALSDEIKLLKEIQTDIVNRGQRDSFGVNPLYRPATYEQPQYDPTLSRYDDYDLASYKAKKAEEELLKQRERERIEAEKKAKAEQIRIELENRRDITSIFSNVENDDKLRQLRALLEAYNVQTNYVSGIYNNPLRTASEEEFVKNFLVQKEILGNFKIEKLDKNGILKTEVERSGKLGDFEELRTSMLAYKRILEDGNLSEKSKLEQTDRLVLIENEYNSVLQDNINYLKKIVELNQKTIEDEQKRQDMINSQSNLTSSENKKASSKSTEGSDSKRSDKSKKGGLYDTFRYSPWRNKEENAQFLKTYEYFAATGNAEQAYRRVLFNKATGYRQRQGLVGFAANIGYVGSGTALSVGLGGLAAALTTATKAVGEFTKGSVKAFEDIQSIQTNLGIVYNSKTQANDTFNEIANYAIKSPFGVQQVSEYAVLLKQSGIYASDLMDTLKQIGDVAGGNQAKFARIANSFAQIEAYGRATTRQLRQFATSGIPIYKELAKELNKDVASIQKMTEQGKITSDIIEKVFRNMTSEGGTFQNAVEIGAKTLKARRQNLADAKQLAQSEIGDYLWNFGGFITNESLFQSVISDFEGLFGSIQSYFKRVNTNNIAVGLNNQREDLEVLQNIYNILSINGSTQETLEMIRDDISKTVALYTPEEQRANAVNHILSNADKYGVTDIYGVENKIDNEEYNRLVAESKKVYLIGADGRYTYSPSTLSPKNYVISLEEYAKGIESQNKAKLTLKTKYSQTSYDKFNKEITEDEKRMYETATAIGYLSKGYEQIDKSMNKNSDGAYSMYQKGMTKWEQTTEGKNQKLKEEIDEWNTRSSRYRELRKLFNEQGILQEGLNSTVKDIVAAFQSGILNPIEELKFTPEDLASDYVLNLTGIKSDDEKILAKRAENWNTIMSNVTGLDALKNASGVSEYVAAQISKFQDDVDGLTNTSLNIAKFSKSFNKLVKNLRDKGFLDEANIVSQVSTVKSLNPEVKDYWEANGNDAEPLWRRILSSSLGLDSKLLHVNDMNAYDAMKLYNTNSQRQLVQNIVKTTLSTTGNIRSLKKLFAGGDKINNYDGTQAFNWDITSRNLSEFASSLEASIEVNRAFTSSLDSQVDALSGFISEALTKVEDGANIYDPKYKEFLGKYFESLEAAGIQAYDLLVDSSGHLRDKAQEYAEALIEQKTELSASVNVLASFREAVKNAGEELAMTKFNYNAQNGAYDNTVLKNMTKDEISNALSTLRSIYNSNESKLKSFNINDISTFIEAMLTGTLPNTLERKYQYMDAPDKNKEDYYKDRISSTSTAYNMKKFMTDEERQYYDILSSIGPSEIFEDAARTAIYEKIKWGLRESHTIPEEMLDNAAESNFQKVLRNFTTYYGDRYDLENLKNERDTLTSEYDDYQNQVAEYEFNKEGYDNETLAYDDLLQSVGQFSDLLSDLMETSVLTVLSNLESAILENTRTLEDTSAYIEYWMNTGVLGSGLEGMTSSEKSALYNSGRSIYSSQADMLDKKFGIKNYGEFWDKYINGTLADTQVLPGVENKEEYQKAIQGINTQMDSAKLQAVGSVLAGSLNSLNDSIQDNTLMLSDEKAYRDYDIKRGEYRGTVLSNLTSDEVSEIYNAAESIYKDNFDQFKLLGIENFGQFMHEYVNGTLGLRKAGDEVVNKDDVNKVLTDSISLLDSATTQAVTGAVGNVLNTYQDEIINNARNSNIDKAYRNYNLKNDYLNSDEIPTMTVDELQSFYTSGESIYSNIASQLEKVGIKSYQEFIDKYQSGELSSLRAGSDIKEADKINQAISNAETLLDNASLESVVTSVTGVLSSLVDSIDENSRMLNETKPYRDFVIKTGGLRGSELSGMTSNEIIDFYHNAEAIYKPVSKQFDKVNINNFDEFMNAYVNGNLSAYKLADNEEGAKGVNDIVDNTVKLLDSAKIQSVANSLSKSLVSLQDSIDENSMMLEETKPYRDYIIKSGQGTFSATTGMSADEIVSFYNSAESIYKGIASDLKTIGISDFDQFMNIYGTGELKTQDVSGAAQEARSRIGQLLELTDTRLDELKKQAINAPISTVLNKFLDQKKESERFPLDYKAYKDYRVKNGELRGNNELLKSMTDDEVVTFYNTAEGIYKDLIPILEKNGVTIDGKEIKSFDEFIDKYLNDKFEVEVAEDVIGAENIDEAIKAAGESLDSTKLQVKADALGTALSNLQSTIQDNNRLLEAEKPYREYQIRTGKHRYGKFYGMTTDEINSVYDEGESLYKTYAKKIEAATGIKDFNAFMDSYQSGDFDRYRYDVKYDNNENIVVDDESLIGYLKQLLDTSRNKAVASTNAQNLMDIQDALENIGIITSQNDRFSDSIGKMRYNSQFVGLNDNLFDNSTKLTYGNTYKQQQFLDLLGQSDKTYEQFLKETLVSDKDDKLKKQIADAYNELKGGEVTEQATKLLSTNDIDKQMVVLGEMVDALGEAAVKAEKLRNVIYDVGNTIKDAFSSAILDVWNNSLKTIGKDLTLINVYGKTTQDTWEDIKGVWKDAGQALLDSIGPAMAQAACSLIASGNIEVGIPLLIASGVTNILSGMLSSYQGANNDETARLQTLKDLLSEIIDQAKTDSDYYQKNLLHQNALSENYAVSSVHDAVISSNGHIITTDPKDFLIATKNPGGLTGNGNVTVNFSLVDKSTGSKVNVQNVNQRQNSDGSVDIEAVVVAVMNKAIANGDCDKGFAAMNQRMNGISYAG